MDLTALRKSTTTRRLVTTIVLALALLIFAEPILSRLETESPSGRWEVPGPVLLLGAGVGLTYGLLAVGLVVVYRTSRIINFAHGEIGAFTAAVFGFVVVQWHVPYWLAFPVALALGGAVAALTETVVVRRLRNAPRIMSIVATLGVGQFLLLLGFVINDQLAGWLYPEPVGFPSFALGGLTVTPALTGMMILSPMLLLSLAFFLKRSRYGIAIRCAAANPDTARLVGIFSSRMSSLAWAIAGVVAAFTAIMTQPTRGFVSAEAFGPSLLLLALAAAVLARMTSLPIAAASGLGIGIVDQVVRWNYPGGGVVEVALFVVIVFALLLQRQRGSREEEKGSWASVQAVRPLPDELKTLWVVRNLGRIIGILAFAIALLLPLIVSNNAATSLTVIYAYAVVALSIGVITGLGGQLTLGQFALAGIGAVVSFHISMRTGWFPLSFLYGGVIAALVALLVGLPALRIRGMLITVTTLAFAVAASEALFRHEWLLGSGIDPGKPVFLGRALDFGGEYYFVGLLVLVIALVLVRNVRHSGLGRLLVAVRDNEDNARAFTVRATAIKLQGVMFAGFIAGLGGAMYGHVFSSLTDTAFPVSASIDVVKIAVIGGISMLAGPLLGVAVVMAVPTFVPLGTLGLAATSLGQLLIIMYMPKGLVQVVVPLRDRLARYFGRRAGLDVDAAFARRDAHADADDQTRQPIKVGHDRRSPRQPAHSVNGHPSGTRLLEVRNLRKSFGGVKAVNDVSFAVHTGETVGLIGPNGAGKTTTFELIGGFTRADHGSVQFRGRDVTWETPEARGRLGLIRSFQDAALFPTLTVEECIMVANERFAPTKFFASVTGIGTGETTKRRQAREVIDLMGLGRYRTKQITELSTGTRRITELACMMALRPTLLLLDEPSSGVAQRETEALGDVLRDLKREFGMTLVIIEHDIPLIMSLSDRIVAMANGEILIIGAPDTVRRDRRVVEAYLGGDITTIERSDTQTPQVVGGNSMGVPVSGRI